MSYATDFNSSEASAMAVVALCNQQQRSGSDVRRGFEPPTIAAGSNAEP